MPPGGRDSVHGVSGMADGPGMSKPLRVTTDPEYVEEHAEGLELWSPGNPVFVPPELTATPEGVPSGKTLQAIFGDG